MKRETSLKTGDLIPQNHILYYVVEKPYEISTKPGEIKLENLYKKGEPVVVVKAFLDGYVPAFKDFLETSCRLATIEEASKFHQKFFDNARVGKVYSDGTFQIRRFYIVESHRDELLEKLDLKKENCSRKINREFVKLLEELCGEKFIYDGYAGCYHGQLFLFTNFAVVDNKSFFKICRKATSSETTKLSLFVKEKQESY